MPACAERDLHRAGKVPTRLATAKVYPRCRKGVGWTAALERDKLCPAPFPGTSYFPISLSVFIFEASVNSKFHFFTFETSFYSCLGFWRGWGKIRDCPQVKVILCSFIIYISDNRMESARLLLLTQTLKTHTLQAFFILFFLHGAHIYLNLFKSKQFWTIYI